GVRKRPRPEHGAGARCDLSRNAFTFPRMRSREPKPHKRKTRKKHHRAVTPTAPPTTTETTPPPTTSPTRNCDPNYKGACLDPNAPDYDCAGRSGDGPKYVQGPFEVVGSDHYGLDRDGDGVACE